MMTATRLHLLLAGLMGAAGVALWAMAAHMAGANAATAAQMLLIHAAAIPGLTAARKGGHLHDGVARTGVSVLILGVALFAGDLTMRAFTGAGLFPLAAPSGGIAMIAGWAMVALAALMPSR
jgi:uncharacterized membrane protein YgdD (TMEM256/DUF423 family)